MDRKIAVLGTGANGSCIGADLTQAGYDVVLIDQWPAHIEAMKAHGLQVKMIRSGDEFRVPVRAFHLCELASLKCQFDIVFLVCKANDSHWMARLIAPYLCPDGVLVSVQNSMCDEWIVPIIGAKRDIGSAHKLSSQLFEPGLVKRNTDHANTDFIIGELDGKITPRIEELAQIMSVVGNTEVSSNIWGVKWTKLIQSTASLPVIPITGVSGMELVDNPEYADFSIKLGSETARVGKALGHVLESAFGIPREVFDKASTEEQVEIILRKIISTLGKQGTDEVEKLAKKPTSTIARLGTERWIDGPTQDLLKGRTTETEYLNGYVVRKGREVNVPTPLNEAINSMMREIELGKRKMMERANFEVLKQYGH
jgi:2-dehydropantoate 2-reductase